MPWLPTDNQGLMGPTPDHLFPGLDDRTLTTAVEAAVSGFDGSDLGLSSSWDTSPFSPSLSLGGPTGNTMGGDRDRDQDFVGPSTASHRGSLSTIDEEDPLDTLSLQLTALNSRAKDAMHRLMRPDSAPPTVNSPVVNEAFESTATFIRILQRIPDASLASTVAMGPGGTGGTGRTGGGGGGEGRESEPGRPLGGASRTGTGTISRQSSPMASGLAFLVLASHQHLLGLYGAICDAVERCLESSLAGASDNHHASDWNGRPEPPQAQAHAQQAPQQRGLHDEGSGPGPGPSSAQYAMVLQLLLHLVGRTYRSLFADCSVSLDGDSNSTTGSSQEGGGAVHARPGTREEPANEAWTLGSGGSLCIPAHVQAIVRTLPDEHVRLKQVLQALLERIEGSDIL